MLIRPSIGLAIEQDEIKGFSRTITEIEWLLLILVLGIRCVYKTARRRRDAAALVALGIPFVLLMKWLAGGQYAVAIFPWLVLGWADWSSRSMQTIVRPEKPALEDETLRVAALR